MKARDNMVRTSLLRISLGGLGCLRVRHPRSDTHILHRTYLSLSRVGQPSVNVFSAILRARMKFWKATTARTTCSLRDNNMKEGRANRENVPGFMYTYSAPKENERDVVF